MKKIEKIKVGEKAFVLWPNFNRLHIFSENYNFDEYLEQVEIVMVTVLTRSKHISQEHKFYVYEVAFSDEEGEEQSFVCDAPISKSKVKLLDLIIDEIKLDRYEKFRQKLDELF